MRRLICFIMIINLFLICIPENSHCYAVASKPELNWDYLLPHENDRNLTTSSLHILTKISDSKTRTVYRGLTITRPLGNTTFEHQTRESSAVGIGPMYMVRNEKYRAGKLSLAVDMSGGFIIYNKIFPAGGTCYNFMWRLGPQLIYKINDNSSFNIGYMLMHVSNGLKAHNPSYNAHGVSWGLTTNF